MKKVLFKISSAALIMAYIMSFLPIVGIQSAYAIPITSLDSAITQNFDTLANTGTPAWADDSTLAGWYAQFGTTTNPITYLPGTGSVNTGALYSFGATGSTDRALGSVGSGSTGDVYWAVKLTNNTPATITSLDVSYTGEQWRAGGCTPTPCTPAAQTVDFQYQVANAGLITDANSPTTGWLDHDPLDFTSPTPGTSTAAALDGNAAANRTGLSSTISVSIAPGQEVWLRWKDINHPNNDHGLAIDDFSVTPHGVVVTNLTIDDVSQNEGNSGTTTFTFTVSLSSPAGAGGVTFDIATADNTATTANNDYTAKSLTSQTIPAGSSTYTFDVLVNGDSTSESSETFFVNVTNVTGATIVDGQGQGTIQNDDVTLPDLTVNDVSLNEGNSGTTSFVFTVSLSTAAGAGGVTFDIATVDGTATVADNDYTAKSLTGQTIATGNTSYTFTVLVNGDTAVESNETFLVNVTNVSGANVVDGQGQGTIQNDDVPPGPAVFFNEIHYDNNGNDTGEAIEIAGPACMDLTGWSVVLYNGNGGAVYDTKVLSGPISSLGGGFGVAVVNYPSNGIQNGSPDGMALVDSANNVIQFLSYEGTFTAVGGPANGMLSTDIGVTENGTGVLGASLQLNGTGSTYNNFTWASDAANTFGAFNTSQTFINGATTSPCGIGAATPSAVYAGDSTLLTVHAFPGTNPASTGLTVTANLTSIGGSANQVFYDDGSHGDLTAGDSVFSYSVTVPSSAAPGIFTIPVALSDAETRTGSASISLTVRPPLSAIHTIQGAAQLSPLNGQLVSAEGIVTAKKSDGFWMQDPNPDADVATSEGIFVFTSSAPTVNAGDSVSVSGTVNEFRPGATGLSITEIASPTVNVLSSGNPTPVPILVGTGGRVPPNTIFEDDAGCGNAETCNTFDPAQDGIDFWEALEGMLVQFNNPVVVGPPAFSGEIPIVGDMGDNAALKSSRGGVIVQPGNLNPERVVLHDAINTNFLTNDHLNVGDHVVGSIVGVLSYDFGNFFFETTGPVTFTSGGLTRESTTAQGPDQLAVGTFNVENLAPSDPQSKFDTLAGLIVNNLKSPDVIGVEEIQDNNGTVNDGNVDATTTWTKLIDAITAAGGPAYQFRQIDPVNGADGGAPGGNIRQGFLFNPARVSFIDRPYTGNGSVSTDAVSVVNSQNGPELSWSPGRIDPTNTAWDASRKPIVGEFLFKDNHVFVVANHFKSKGGDDPLMGPHQPPIESTAVQRIQQAQVEHDFLQSIFSLDANANVVVVGDLNDFQFSTSVKTLTGESISNVILHDLISTLPANERYTYDFEGNSETLDHILISNHLFNSVPFTEDVVHVNSEFWDQASDHEPEVATLTLPQVNRAPVTVDDSYSTDEDTPLNVAAPGVLSNDTDADNNALTAILVSNVAHGALTLNSDGSFTYTPAANYNGPDSFTYKANDGSLDSNTAAVSITVNAINDAPVAANDSYSTNEDTTLSITAPGVLGNDTDVDGNSLTAVLVNGPTHGSLTLNSNGSLSYTPALNYNGSDSFTYKANDGTANSNTATVSITINAVNDPPIANPDSATVSKNNSVTISILANDTDVDGDTLTVTSFTQPAHGTVAYSSKNKNFRYTPAKGFSGTDTFTYTISDGHGGTATGTVTITVK